MSTAETIENTEQPRTLMPLWLSVALSILIIMPTGLWLGKYNFTLWAVFIVWAQYFALGGQPSALRLIIPSFSAGMILTCLTVWSIPFLSSIPHLLVPGDLATIAAVTIGVGLMVLLMERSKTLTDGSLPYFNGVSMAFAILFTSSYPADLIAGLPNEANAAIWGVLMGVVGAFLGMLNIVLYTPWTAFKNSDNSDK